MGQLGDFFSLVSALFLLSEWQCKDTTSTLRSTNKSSLFFKKNALPFCMVCQECHVSRVSLRIFGCIHRHNIYYKIIFIMGWKTPSQSEIVNDLNDQWHSWHTLVSVWINVLFFYLSNFQMNNKFTFHPYFHPSANYLRTI